MHSLITVSEEYPASRREIFREKHRARQAEPQEPRSPGGLDMCGCEMAWLCSSAACGMVDQGPPLGVLK
jgi:hypothetical protein